MTKIVFNARYGGFSLSRKAVELARELSGNPNWGGPCIIGDKYDDRFIVERDYGYIQDIPRTDPFLVQVVEQLGEAANGMHARLRIADVPAGTKYIIKEYDGNESVKTIDDFAWLTA